MADEKLKISVVIPTKNRFQDIIKCIDSILIQTLLPDEIVIVDASDTQELNSKIKEFKSEKTKFVYVHTKPGLTYQRNVGVKVSSGDIVIFLDDDVILDKNFIKEIMHIFNDDLEKKVGGVVGNPINNTEKQSYSLIYSIKRSTFIIFVTIFFLIKPGNGKFRLSGFPAHTYGVNKILNVECLPGGLTAYRRAVLNEFKFDENLHGYCFMEDDDFSYRVSRKYINVYTPYAKVIHNVSPVARDSEYPRMKMLIENHHYLFKKNIPQTFKHKFAFYMSIIGLFIAEMMSILMERNANGLKGLIDGMRNINKKR